MPSGFALDRERFSYGSLFKKELFHLRGLLLYLVQLELDGALGLKDLCPFLSEHALGHLGILCYLKGLCRLCGTWSNGREDVGFLDPAYRRELSGIQS